jgi:hypothetical protein
VFRQEIFDGSRTAIGSATVTLGADICSYSFQFLQFLVLGEHLLAGVNEWLTIRNLHREIFRWLLICRCDIRHGSRRRNLVLSLWSVQVSISGRSCFAKWL